MKTLVLLLLYLEEGVRHEEELEPVPVPHQDLALLLSGDAHLTEGKLKALFGWSM
jgi:hypothetical protein